jgi:hypothetical protein
MRLLLVVLVFFQGASDVIRNNDGLTCYEGLNRAFIQEHDYDDIMESEARKLLQWKT